MSRLHWFSALVITLLHPLLFGVSRAPAEEPVFPGLVKREFIYDKVPFPQCHASTICEARVVSDQSDKPKLTLVAAWFGGTKEKHPDVGIWVSRLDGDKWTDPVEVANGLQPDGKRHPTWNPVLFQNFVAPEPLMLFYKVGPDPKTWWGMMVTSDDAGKTWSKPIQLPKGIVGPIKNKPVQLTDREIVSPTSTEDQGWRVHFELGIYTGKKPYYYDWQVTPAINTGKDFGAIQPTILVHGPQDLQALCRTQNGSIAEAWSEDAGKSWSVLRATKLPNANSGIDAVSLRNGDDRHLLIYNHVDPGLIPKGWGKRTPLNLALTVTGLDWHAVGVLEKEQGEYSYPAIIQTEDGLVHMTYTWQRTKIRHVVVDPEKFDSKRIVEGKWPETVMKNVK